MERKSKPPSFPRRDGDGRVVSLAELVFAAVASTVVGVLGVTIIDGLIALVGLSDFGDASGWLAAILPAFLFVDDFRAWREADGWRRWPVVLVAGTVGIGAGLAAAGLAGDLPHLVSGAVGAVVLALVYAVAWYAGVRVLRREGSG